jgi:hypothetical protein
LFLDVPFNFRDNTWYRLVVAETGDQKYRVSVYDDSLRFELVGRPLKLDREFFQSGMKIKLTQSMGTPDGTYPVDVAIDWIKLSTE